MMTLINLAGLGLIGLIVWWFWLYRPGPSLPGNGNVVVTVENGVYSPTRINLPKGQPAVLTFLRKDPSPCAEIVMIPQLDINQTLPLDRSITIELPALAKGEYAFHCQMQMYRGVIVAE